MRRLEWDDVRARRLRRHGLLGTPTATTPADVVRAMHGAHAQVISAAELSIALRLPGSTRTDVRDALWLDRSLTKTFGPRGTVHLIPTADLPMWTGALAAVPAHASAFARDVRLTDDQRTQVVAAVADALRGPPLTLEELDDAVVARTGRWAGDLVMPAFQVNWPRWRQAVSDAATAGVLVFGPPRGRKVTYTRDPHLVPLPADAALPSFLDGYLHAFGPSTPAHLARWLNAPVGWVEELFERAALETVQVAGTTAWVAAGDAAADAADHAADAADHAAVARDLDIWESRSPSCIRLLPYFDAFTVGFQPREALFPGRAAERALARGQAGNYPVVLVDGVVGGVWHQRRSGRRVTLTVELLRDLPGARHAELEAQAMRVGEVLEAGSTELVLGPVEVGPHA
jgi:Winged helix DNA-binding domain